MRHKSYSDGTNIAIFNVLWGKLSSHLERGLRMVKLQDVVCNRNEPPIRTRIASLRTIGWAFMGSFCPDSVVPHPHMSYWTGPHLSQLTFFFSRFEEKETFLLRQKEVHLFMWRGGKKTHFRGQRKREQEEKCSHSWEQMMFLKKKHLGRTTSNPIRAKHKTTAYLFIVPSFARLGGVHLCIEPYHLFPSCVRSWASVSRQRLHI